MVSAGRGRKETETRHHQQKGPKVLMVRILAVVVFCTVVSVMHHHVVIATTRIIHRADSNEMLKFPTTQSSHNYNAALSNTEVIPTTATWTTVSSSVNEKTEHRSTTALFSSHAAPFPSPLQQQQLEARAFSPWNRSKGPVPCFEWPIQEDGTPRKLTTFEPVDQGFLFAKPEKVGGSTAAGIHLRFTHNLAKRMGYTTKIKSFSRKAYETCFGRWNHGLAKRVYPNRSKTKSFLWTVIRDPTKRAVSEFFHFRVSKHNISASAVNFSRALSLPKLQDYYLRYLATDPELLETLALQRSDEAAWAVLQHIVGEYDFVGVTERMDETAVAFMMLVNGTLNDILHINAKDAGKKDYLCNDLAPVNVTSEMKFVLRSDMWYSQSKWDQVLYDWANRSLTKTIRGLNASQFAANLKAFRSAQSIIQLACGKLHYRCTEQRKPHPENDCLFKDSACAVQCIDQVVKNMGLEDVAAVWEKEFPPEN